MPNRDSAQFGLGTASLALDVFTLGSASVVKGAVMATVKMSAKALGKTAAREVATTSAAHLLTSAPAKLTQKGLEHAVLRHWATSSAKGAGKFTEGTTARGLKEMIKTTTTQGTFRANTRGRTGTIAEYSFNRIIGTTSGGSATSGMRVIISPTNQVITAFPF